MEKAKTVVMTPFKLARRPIVALYSKVVWTLWPAAGGATGTAPPVLTGHNPERYGDKAQLDNEWGREKTAEAEFVKGVHRRVSQSGVPADIGQSVGGRELTPPLVPDRSMKAAERRPPGLPGHFLPPGPVPLALGRVPVAAASPARSAGVVVAGDRDSA